MTAVQYISILLAALFFTAVLIWDVETDLKKWVKTQQGIPTPVRHFSEFWLRVLLLLPTIILLTVAHPDEQGWHRKTLVVLSGVCALVGALYWLLFDGIYNLRRNMKWSFPGSFGDSGHPDSVLDKVVLLMGDFAVVFKIIAVAGMLTWYILSFII